MAICIYCGKPVGLFRRQHSECHAQHDAAVQTIPDFFTRMGSSSLSAVRFGELLRNAAAASYVTAEEFKKLSVAGIGKLIDAKLANDLISVADEDRIIEIADAVDLRVSEQPELEERFIKIATLRDLEIGEIPDHVSVSGPIPLDLAPDETIIWIFNGAKRYRYPRSERPDVSPAPNSSEQFLSYFPPPAPPFTKTSLEGLVEEGPGDLVITNKTLFMLTEDRQKKYPFARMTVTDPRSNGFRILRPTDNRPVTFVVDDGWFAANLVITLARHANDIDPGSGHGDQTDAPSIQAPIE